MSKSILVIDTPKSCADCDLCHTEDYDYRRYIDGNKVCGAENMCVNNYYQNNAKPNWCQLHEMPQKKEKIPIKMNCDYEANLYANGYNAAIDDILKDEQ